MFTAFGVVSKAQPHFSFHANPTLSAGTLAPLASITLVRTVSFSIYQRAKYTLDDWIYKQTGTSPLKVANTQGALPNLSTVACFSVAGAVSGAAVTAIACMWLKFPFQAHLTRSGHLYIVFMYLGPFELTKLSAQLSVLMATNKGSMAEPVEPPRNHVPQNGTLRTAINLVRLKGMMGLYSGFNLHLCKLYIIITLYQHDL